VLIKGAGGKKGDTSRLYVYPVGKKRETGIMHIGGKITRPIHEARVAVPRRRIGGARGEKGAYGKACA